MKVIAYVRVIACVIVMIVCVMRHSIRSIGNSKESFVPLGDRFTFDMPPPIIYTHTHTHT